MARSYQIYVPVFSVTLILSAFLLFLVQPMIGKMLLPLLGGSPSVWNTAMVFFQAMLLAGYAYAHLTTRLLRPVTQATLHVVLLGLFTLALPIAVPEGWTPPETSNPAFWQLSLMAVMAGGPFFVVAGTAPMMQRWFSHTNHPDAHNPYFLYSASNLGSMGALLSYPFLIEPLFKLSEQSRFWAEGYIALIGLSVICGLLIWKALRQEKHPRAGKETGGESTLPEATGEGNITRRQVALWLLLAFIPSSLMLGVTTFITTDLASVPLLWLIPLSLYVGTFIIAFARRQIVSTKTLLLWQAVSLVAVIWLFMSGYPGNLFLVILIHLVLFTTTTLYCHIRLAATRPPVRHLTAFYLLLSLGGVLGGTFNALIAPVVFTTSLEYPIALILAMLVRHQGDPRASWSSAKQRLPDLAKKADFRKNFEKLIFSLIFVLLTILVLHTTQSALRIALPSLICGYLLVISDKRWLFAAATALVLLLHNGSSIFTGLEVIARERNYFGILRVADTPDGIRFFLHGTTLHGAQSLNDKYKTLPLTYYYKKFTPVWEAFTVLDQRHKGPQDIAVIGLGVGSLACYNHPGRHIDFYDIDPDVVRISQDPGLFSFLSDCGMAYDILLGDGRLKLGKASDDKYDLIYLDAFNSDHIPTHLLTVEAFETYFEKLKKDRFIIVHISNRHFHLEPVLAAIAREKGWAALFKISNSGKDEETGLEYAGSEVAVIAQNPETLEPFLRDLSGWKLYDVPPSYKAWRDDYSNLFRAIRFKTRVLKANSENESENK